MVDRIAIAHNTEGFHVPAGEPAEHLGSTIIALSGVNSRLDRLTDRVERIETRLDLTDTH